MNADIKIKTASHAVQKKRLKVLPNHVYNIPDVDSKVKEESDEKRVKTLNFYEFSVAN